MEELPLLEYDVRPHHLTTKLTHATVEEVWAVVAEVAPGAVVVPGAAVVWPVGPGTT